MSCWPGFVQSCPRNLNGWSGGKDGLRLWFLTYFQVCLPICNIMCMLIVAWCAWLDVLINVICYLCYLSRLSFYVFPVLAGSRLDWIQIKIPIHPVFEMQRFFSERSKKSSKEGMARQRNASVTKAARKYLITHSLLRIPSDSRNSAYQSWCSDHLIHGYLLYRQFIQSTFKGGPGGGKTRHAVKIRDEFESRGLAHICVPDLIKDAISRYKDKYPEWEEAARRYERGSFKQSAKIFQLSRRTHP